MDMKAQMAAVCLSMGELGLDIFPKMNINKLVHPCIKIRMVPVR